MLPVGTLVNVAAVLGGGFLGLVIGRRFPEGMRSLVFQGLGLCVLIIGVQMALTFTNPLLMIFSILLGGVTGELLHLEEFFASLGDRVKRLVRSRNTTFTDGMITASLLYCVGSMAILGSFDEGLRGDPTLLFTKSMLDGFASIALASTYGIGVLFSVVPLFLYQFSLTLFASMFREVIATGLITELTAVGGLLIIGIGINLMKLTYIRISNLLPALGFIVVLAKIFGEG